MPWVLIYILDGCICGYYQLKGSLWENMEKYAVFQANMVNWGKYSTGRYGQIGVYRDNLVLSNIRYTLYTQVKHTTI